MEKKIFKIIDILINEGGFKLSESAAICGNIITESKCDPNYNNVVDGTVTGGGMLNWVGVDFYRLKRYAEARNKKWNEFKLQIDFIIEDFENFVCNLNNKNKGKTLIGIMRENNQLTSSQLSDIICTEYLKVDPINNNFKIRWMNTTIAYKDYIKFIKN